MRRITRKRRIGSPYSVYNKSFKEFSPGGANVMEYELILARAGKSIGQNREVDNLSEAPSQSRAILATSEDMSVSQSRRTENFLAL